MSFGLFGSVSVCNSGALHHQTEEDFLGPVQNECWQQVSPEETAKGQQGIRYRDGVLAEFGSWETIVLPRVSFLRPLEVGAV